MAVVIADDIDNKFADIDHGAQVDLDLIPGRWTVRNGRDRAVLGSAIVQPAARNHERQKKQDRDQDQHTVPDRTRIVRCVFFGGSHFLILPKRRGRCQNFYRGIVLLCSFAGVVPDGKVA